MDTNINLLKGHLARSNCLRFPPVPWGNVFEPYFPGYSLGQTFPSDVIVMRIPYSRIGGHVKCDGDFPRVSIALGCSEITPRKPDAASGVLYPHLGKSKPLSF
jgi:hypothetical protein